MNSQPGSVEIQERGNGWPLSILRPGFPDILKQMVPVWTSGSKKIKKWNFFLHLKDVLHLFTSGYLIPSFMGGWLSALCPSGPSVLVVEGKSSTVTHFKGKDHVSSSLGLLVTDVHVLFRWNGPPKVTAFSIIRCLFSSPFPPITYLLSHQVKKTHPWSSLCKLLTCTIVHLPIKPKENKREEK